MPQQLEDLKLSEDQAEAIIEKGIEYGAYSDEMPDTKKEKLAAADEIVSFSIDAYINDGITSEDDDPAVAESGRQIEEIMDLAGVSIEDGEAVFGDAPEAEEAEEDGEDDNGGDEEEAPFDPDDYIEGYSELSVVTKLKKVKELDIESDDDVSILNAIYDWENEQEKPSSRILNYIDEALGEGEEGEGEEEPEEDDSNGDEPEAEEEGGEGEEPWDGYDKASATEIKKVLQEAADDEESPLTREQVEYVLEYEEGREKPPTRKRVVDFCNALLAQFDNGDDAEEEPEEEEKPKRGRGRGRSKPKEDKPKAESNGIITLTREQILTALDSGEVQIEFGE